jgi:hypothetical protein
MKHGPVKGFLFDSARGTHEFRKRLVLKIKLKCLKWDVLRQIPGPGAKIIDFMAEIQ